LSVAKGRLKLAQEDCDSEHLDDVDGALERMNTLIEDILTLAREGSDVGEMEVIETEEFVEDCWSNVETETATLVTELEQNIKADPRRLKQLCENLVRNAVEHSSAGSRTESDDAVEDGAEGVTITVGELEDRTGFYIADDGEGIPEEERDEVFETGYSTSEDGTGFGLSIVEEIVTAHGWEIEVTESETGGARFEISGIRLPEE
jgi:signal transduction histidine kinase